MTGWIVALALGYALLAAATVGLVLFTRAPAVLRLGLTLCLAAFLFVTYRGVGELRGLPSDRPPPERFRLLWGQITEPNSLTGDAGAIYLWLIELDAQWYPVGVPRAHRLPYSADLAGTVETALMAVADGESIAGEMGAAAEAETTAERLAEDLAEGADAGQAGQAGAAPGDRVARIDVSGLTFRTAEAPVQPEKRD